MNIHESAEDYLEAILRLKEAKGYARSVDISLLLGVTKPSVSVAMKRLRENGYLTMDADNLITLTPAGMEIARSIYDRHKTLSSFLESLGVDSDVAREDACKIEHDISEESFTAIRKLMQEREQHPDRRYGYRCSPAPPATRARQRSATYPACGHAASGPHIRWVRQGTGCSPRYGHPGDGSTP